MSSANRFACRVSTAARERYFTVLYFHFNTGSVQCRMIGKTLMNIVNESAPWTAYNSSILFLYAHPGNAAMFDFDFAAR